MTDECRKRFGEAAVGHCEASPGLEPEGSAESAVSLTSTELAHAHCGRRTPPVNGGLTARDALTWPRCQAQCRVHTHTCKQTEYLSFAPRSTLPHHPHCSMLLGLTCTPLPLCMAPSRVGKHQQAARQRGSLRSPPSGDPTETSQLPLGHIVHSPCSGEDSFPCGFPTPYPHLSNSPLIHSPQMTPT